MAILIQFQDQSDLQFATVETHVGPGRNSKHSDIVLVQTLLSSIYSAGHPRFRSPLRNRLAVTGRFNNDTATLILHYQVVIQRRNAVGSDGVVSPARPDRSVEEATRIWTIIHLFTSFTEALGLADRNLEAIDALRLIVVDPELSRELDSEIVVVPS
jgi:hypothetical protein